MARRLSTPTGWYKKIAMEIFLAGKLVKAGIVSQVSPASSPARTGTAGQLPKAGTGFARQVKNVKC